MKPLDCLKSACNRTVVDPGLKPIRQKDGQFTTYCNFAVDHIVGDAVWGKGAYHKLSGLLADQIYAALQQGDPKAEPPKPRGALADDWKEVTWEEAETHALAGRRVLATMDSVGLGQPHGHVAVCYPAPAVFSGKLGRKNPMIANVGIENRIYGASFAFRVAPEFYVLVRDVPVA